MLLKMLMQKVKKQLTEKMKLEMWMTQNRRRLIFSLEIARSVPGNVYLKAASCKHLNALFPPCEWLLNSVGTRAHSQPC